MSKRRLPVNVYQNGARYMAIVRAEGKRNYLGSFDTPEEAAERAALFREHHPKKTKPVWQPGDEL